MLDIKFSTSKYCNHIYIFRNHLKRFVCNLNFKFCSKVPPINILFLLLIMYVINKYNMYIHVFYTHHIIKF